MRYWLMKSISEMKIAGMPRIYLLFVDFAMLHFRQ